MPTLPKLAGLAVVAAAILGAPKARAQPALPPPPPPPLEQPEELPPLPPAPANPPRSPTPPKRGTRPPRPPAYIPPPWTVRRRRERQTVYVVEEPTARPLTLTWNPVGLFWGRLSAGLELLLAPHHSLVLSPNVLIVDAQRGSAFSPGLGFASQTSSGFGAELGYHYWWRWHHTPRGPFFGPSLLLGTTTNATARGVTSDAAQGYVGLAFDIGEQEVLPGGFTIGAGLGLGIVRMASETEAFPRFLLQVGWSF